MRKIAFLLAGLFVSLCIAAQASDPKLNGIEAEIEELMEAYGTVGASIAIVKNDEIVYSRGFGYRDFENKKAMTENTVMPIGSITKSFTSLLIGSLAESEDFSLSDKPSDYIPDLWFYNDKMDMLITIEDLLSHKSGLGVMDASSVFFPTTNLKGFIPRFKYLQPTGEIKNSFQYSNAGYGLLGLVIENYTGSSWDENVEERIFSLLNMENSCTTISQMLEGSNYSLGYGKSGDEEKKVPFHEFSFIKPGGSICSSVNDMANFIIAWLNNGAFNGEQVLPKAYAQSAMEIKNILPQDQATAEDFLMGYGYGWFVRSSKGRYLVEHGGGTSGFTSLLSMFPNEKLGIIILTNQHNSGLAYFIKDIVINRMFDYPKKDISEYPVTISNIYEIPEDEGMNNDNKPTNRLSDFEGTYLHKGHGEIRIVLKNEKLFAHFPTYIFRLDHLENNAFIMQATTENSQYFNPAFSLSFDITENKNVSSLNLNFHPDLVVFKKIE